MYMLASCGHIDTADAPGARMQTFTA